MPVFLHLNCPHQLPVFKKTDHFNCNKQHDALLYYNLTEWHQPEGKDKSIPILLKKLKTKHNDKTPPH